MCDLRDFSWTQDRDSIVLPEQPETAVYTNGKGFVVIRQNGWPDDEDAVVIIDPNNVRKLVAAMFAAAGITEAPMLALPKPQGRASDTSSMPHRQNGREATGDLLEGIANG